MLFFTGVREVLYLSYFCDKCNRNHVRGSIYTDHKIYDNENSIEVTEEVEANPWTENCFDCENHGAFWYGPGGGGKATCEFLSLKLRKEDIKRTIYIDGDIGGGIPKPCFRVPRTSKIYRKCKYYKKEVKKENGN